MSSNTDKAKGAINETVGKIKHDIGGKIGSDELQAKGAMQESKGNMQKAVGNAKDAVKHGIDKLAGEAHRSL